MYCLLHYGPFNAGLPILRLNVQTRSNNNRPLDASLWFASATIEQAATTSDRLTSLLTAPHYWMATDESRVRSALGLHMTGLRVAKDFSTLQFISSSLLFLYLPNAFHSQGTTCDY